MQYRLNCRTQQWQEEYVTTYGISCRQKQIYDISVNQFAVMQLIRKCNRYQLDSDHLEDIVYDFLSDYCMEERKQFLTIIWKEKPKKNLELRTESTGPIVYLVK